MNLVLWRDGYAIAVPRSKYGVPTVIRRAARGIFLEIGKSHLPIPIFAT